MGRISMFVFAMLAALPSAMAANVPERFASSAAVTLAGTGSTSAVGRLSHSRTCGDSASPGST